MNSSKVPFDGIRDGFRMNRFGTYLRVYETNRTEEQLEGCGIYETFHEFLQLV